MPRKAKIIRCFIVFVILLSMFPLSAIAKEKKIGTNSYPIVLVPGFMGWGREELGQLFYYWGGRHDIQQQLENEGHRVFTASIGPFSSNWDRACELYAFIKGGTVDYGEQHSRKYGHKRFGRTYPGVYPEWGEIDPKTGKVNKIHLVGHSMGGQTIRLLVELLKNGNIVEAENIDCSGLFKGGKNWICSVTTISATHDGTPVADEENILIDLAKDLISQIGSITGIKKDVFDKLYDFNLDQWGLERKDDESLKDYLKRIKESEIWNKNNKDIGLWDLSTRGAKQLNEWVDTHPDVYYFSWSTKATKTRCISGREVPDKKVMNPILYPLSRFICTYTRDEEPIIDRKWWANDGCVSVISQNAPKLGVVNPKIKNWNKIPNYSDVEKGIWYHMPILDSVDHLSIIGNQLKYKESNVDIKRFYSDLASNLSSISE